MSGSDLVKFYVGVCLHQAYIEALTAYQVAVKKSGKGSWAARRALKILNGFLIVKSNLDDRFWCRRVFEGPSPFYAQNPLLRDGAK